MSVVVQYVALVTLLVKFVVNVLSFSSNVASKLSTTSISGFAITFIFDSYVLFAAYSTVAS